MYNNKILDNGLILSTLTVNTKHQGAMAALQPSKFRCQGHIVTEFAFALRSIHR